MLEIYIDKDISSHDLLEKVLTKYKIKPELVYNEFGKPYLKNNDLYFNISHADNYIILVISEKEIGIDMEKITMKPRVMERVCTPDEQKLIKSPDDFTIMWVKKESYVKFLGVGLSYGLANVDTLKNPNFQIIKYRDYYISIYEE